MRPMLVREFLSRDLAEECAKMIDDAVDKGLTEKDVQAPLSEAIYGLHEGLLYDTAEKMCKLSGLPLLPTYTYCRRYEIGDELKAHVDRPSCEFSATVCLKNEVAPWEFHWIGDSVFMEQGDAVLYPGCKISHWREPNNTGGRVWQTFLHYVDKNGPYANNADEIKRRKK